MIFKKPTYQTGKNDLPKSAISFGSVRNLSVNLLPQEVALQRQENSKTVLITKVSIFLLVALVFFTSTTLALRFTQNLELKKNQDNLVYAEGQVSSMRAREEKLVALRDRLDSIRSLKGGDEERKAMFNLVVYLMPPEIDISDVTVEKNSDMSFSISTASLASLQTLISNLGDNEKNSGMISKVSLENLSQGKDGSYKMSLKVTAKK